MCQCRYTLITIVVDCIRIALKFPLKLHYFFTILQYAWSVILKVIILHIFLFSALLLEVLKVFGQDYGGLKVDEPSDQDYEAINDHNA